MKILGPKPFWEYELCARTHDYGHFWAETGLANKALVEKGCVFRWQSDANLKDDKTIEDLTDRILAVSKNFFVTSRKISGYSYQEIAITSEDFSIELTYYKSDGRVASNCSGLNERELLEVREVVREYTQKSITKGKAFVIMSDDSGTSLREMGIAGEDFVESNYRPEVVVKYRHVIADLKSSNPCGRIVILNGPPGSGKTHLIRAVMNEVSNAMFFVVPSNMLSQLGSPSMIKALCASHKKGQSMVMLIEDADEALSSRKSDNVSEISALLNLSDGIFGAILDLRVLATTNIDVGGIDPAVVRDGRLCQNIEIGKHDAEGAKNIYKRLCDKDTDLFTKGNYYVLGEIYKAAKGLETESSKKKPKARVGFSIEPDEDAPEEYDMGVETFRNSNKFDECNDFDLVDIDPDEETKKDLGEDEEME